MFSCNNACILPANYAWFIGQTIDHWAMGCSHCLVWQVERFPNVGNRTGKDSILGVAPLESLPIELLVRPCCYLWIPFQYALTHSVPVDIHREMPGGGDLIPLPASGGRVQLSRFKGWRLSELSLIVWRWTEPVAFRRSLSLEPSIASNPSTCQQVSPTLHNRFTFAAGCSR
jgi:hypothetical protein